MTSQRRGKIKLHRLCRGEDPPMDGCIKLRMQKVQPTGDDGNGCACIGTYSDACICE